MYDLAKFTRDDLLNCALALRNIGPDCKSMEEVANRMVLYLHKHLLDGKTAEPACTLVRFFKTHPYTELNEELQKAAFDILGSYPERPLTRCLTLLATTGDELDWNSRHTSKGHKTIPLISRDFVAQVPMISQLIQQFGLEIDTVLEPTSELLVKLERQVFEIFYIPEALGSIYIPAQKQFVIPYKIKSVLGFGGMLPSGNIFTILLFSKTSISQSTANLFKWISAYVLFRLVDFDRGIIFNKK